MRKMMKKEKTLSRDVRGLNVYVIEKSRRNSLKKNRVLVIR
jgi:hypothetical protein